MVTEFGLDADDVVRQQLGDVGNPRRDAHVHEHLGQRGHRLAGQLGERPAGATTASSSATALSVPSPVVAWSAKMT
jgi:hypothetical protein